MEYSNNLDSQIHYNLRKEIKGTFSNYQFFQQILFLEAEIQVPQMKTVNKTHLYHPIDLAILDRLGYRVSNNRLASKDALVCNGHTKIS